MVCHQWIVLCGVAEAVGCDLAGQHELLLLADLALAQVERWQQMSLLTCALCEAG